MISLATRQPIERFGKEFQANVGGEGWGVVNQWGQTHSVADSRADAVGSDRGTGREFCLRQQMVATHGRDGRVGLRDKPGRGRQASFPGPEMDRMEWKIDAAIALVRSGEA